MVQRNGYSYCCSHAGGCGRNRGPASNMRFITLSSLLWPILRHAVWSPRAIAVVDDHRTYSYGSLLGGAMHVAQHIDATADVAHVGVMLPTSGAFPIALLGCWLSRRVAVPLNYLLAKDELEYVIGDSDIDTLITVGPMLDFLDHQDSAAAIPPSVRLLRLDQMDFTVPPDLRWPPWPDAEDLAVILYTSGTSGRPKGVMLTHGNLRADAEAAIEHAGITSADGFLGVLPQFHSFGLTALTLIPLRCGAKAIYTARFVPRKIVQLIKKHRPDIFMAVPSMYGALLSVKGLNPEDVSSLRLPISGGEPLPDAVYEAYRDRLDLKILEGYGLTETSPATHWSTPAKNKRHSVGLALPGIRVTIVDETDQPLAPGEEGEICLSGPMIMAGYYKKPELTEQVMVELERVTRPVGDTLQAGKHHRAFRTGDIGRVDEQGYLYITGRKKEMLIIGGENVFPREIEEVLNRHRAVHDSAVIGKSDGMRGEIPVAFVELEEEARFDEAEIRRYCRENLAQFKVPRQIQRIDQLPRNATGKILRRQLSMD